VLNFSTPFREGVELVLGRFGYIYVSLNPRWPGFNSVRYGVGILKNMVCETCGNLNPPVYKKRGNMLFQVLLVIPFFTLVILISLKIASTRLWLMFVPFIPLWKAVSNYRACSKCGGRILFKAGSPEGQKVLQKFYELNQNRAHGI
jgi:hypothetical protein